ncbi:MAG: hypothetical protein KKF27_21395 [Gammaproteobacteria bacterium]|nr:hypothetical protein [Gammaproteobacteria bacterium]MBU2685804.1 hypothetical protein [Gammaproteobacteria bacterium]
MTQDDTYQTKVYHELGGDALVIGSGGIGRVESGGGFRKPVVVIGPSTQGAGATGSVFSVASLPFSYGIIIFSGASNVQSASWRMGPCSVGADIMLILRGDPTGTFVGASTQLDVSISGADCIILGSDGLALTIIELNTSLYSDCFVHLKCFTDNVWSIVAQGGDINEA